jgi:hypothetical protein
LEIEEIEVFIMEKKLFQHSRMVPAKEFDFPDRYGTVVQHQNNAETVGKVWVSSEV